MKSDFIIALTQLAAERNLPREIVLSAIEAALISAYKRDSVATGQDISVKLDPNSGDVNVYTIKTVAEDIEDSNLQISLRDARKIKIDAEVGDTVPTGILPHSGGRIAAQMAKQVVIQRLREAERELVLREFSDKEGEVFTVTIQRMEPSQIIVELGRAEATLPTSEQAPYERYRVGTKVKVLLKSVRESTKGPEIIVSRADKELVRRLFEMEVPEIYNGAVEIVALAREPGSRTKVAVHAKQDGVDAVGSCVGLRGIRIQNIVNELHGEKIDVVQWSKDPATYISNSLNPSSVMRVDLDAGTQSAVAVVPDRQLSLAIGKEGQNARLSARLTGWNVDIKSNIDVEAAQEVAQPEPPVSDVVQEAEAIVTEQTKEPAVETPSEPSIHLETEDVVEESLGTVEEVEPRVAEVEESASVESQVVEIEETGLVEVAPAVEQPAFTNIVPEVLIPELEETEPEKPTVAAESTSIQDLPEDVWSIRRNTPSAPGVIRFAEDIDELRGFGARRGRGGGRKGGQGGRKKSKAGRRR